MDIVEYLESILLEGYVFLLKVDFFSQLSKSENLQNYQKQNLYALFRFIIDDSYYFSNLERVSMLSP